MLLYSDLHPNSYPTLCLISPGDDLKNKSLVFLTILLLPVKIRKPVFISVKHLSVLGAPGGYNHSVPSSSLSWPPKRWKQLLHIIFQTLVSSLQTVQAVHPCGDNIFHSCPALQSVPFLHLLMQNQRYPYCP